LVLGVGDFYWVGGDSLNVGCVLVGIWNVIMIGLSVVDGWRGAEWSWYV
jgi:hypothetical protein